MAMINVICSRRLISEIEEMSLVLPSTTNRCVFDFLNTLKTKGESALEAAERMNTVPDAIVSTELHMECPKFIKEHAFEIQLKTANNLTELFLLMEHIQSIPDEEFL